MTSPSALLDFRGLLGELWSHLTHRRRKQFGLLLLLMVASAFAELVSLGSILPFLGVLVSPERILANPTAQRLAQAAGITTAENLVLPLTVAFVIVVLGAALIRTSLLYASTRFAFAVGADLSLDVYKRTLHQPYAVHVARNSSETISGITSKIHDVVFGVLVPLLTLLSASVLLITVLIALIAFKPAIALSAMTGFGALYGVISFTSRRRLRLNSERIAREQTQVIKALQEGLGGIRDVLLDGTQAFYCDIYRTADSRLRIAQAENAFTSQSPRFAMESLGMIALACFAYVLHGKQGGIAAALPLLGGLALAVQRLLPALQQVHTAWASIVGYQATLTDAIRLLDQPAAPSPTETSSRALSFRSTIRLNQVSFRYTEEGPWVLNDVNVTIRKGARIGLVGGTGSGKSTLLDVLMGLLLPTEGSLRVDDEIITRDNVRAWQQLIAHVPQSIYLADASIAENIAFGRRREEIDMQRVREAARRAQIADFIESRVAGYEELVGERGVRLSGGQRQRIGIARALYRDARVLVFDEATSALDSATERSVMEAIEGLGSDLTVLIIAHRLTTVRHCDVIFEVERGRIVAQGKYEELFQRSPNFQRLAGDTGAVQNAEHVRR